MLTAAIAPAHASISELAGVNHLSSVGTHAIRVTVPTPAVIRYAFGENDARLSSGGRYAALIVRGRGTSPQNRVMLVFMRPTSDGECTLTTCWNQEDEVAIGHADPGDPQGTMSLPAGPYELTLVAEAGEAVTAHLVVDGLDGSRSFELAAPSSVRASYIQSAQTSPPKFPGPMWVGGVMEGTHSDRIGDSGVLLVWAWRAFEIGHSDGEYLCVGPGDGPGFGGRGSCVPEHARSGGQEDLYAMNWRSGLGRFCYTAMRDPDCLPNTEVRAAYRFEHQALSETSGGVWMWVELPPSV